MSASPGGTGLVSPAPEARTGRGRGRWETATAARRRTGSRRGSRLARSFEISRLDEICVVQVLLPTSGLISPAGPRRIDVGPVPDQLHRRRRIAGIAV